MDHCQRRCTGHAHLEELVQLAPAEVHGPVLSACTALSAQWLQLEERERLAANRCALWAAGWQRCAIARYSGEASWRRGATSRPTPPLASGVDPLSWPWRASTGAQYCAPAEGLHHAT